MAKKLTYEEVKQVFSKGGCELLSTEYHDYHDKFTYRCNCGDIAIITLPYFKIGRRCKKCGVSKAALKRKLTYEFVKNEFSKAGCELLSTEYLNNHSKLAFRCFCGNLSTISYNDFQYGKRCRKCGISKRASQKRLSYNSVKTVFEKRGYKLLSETYHNSASLLDFICPNGHQHKITWGNFQQGQKCKKCYDEEPPEPKFSTGYIKNYMKEHGCKLISAHRHKNTKSKLLFECRCGTISETTFQQFKEVKRCRNCGRIKQANSKRLAYDIVKIYFSNHGCELLSTVFKSAHTKLKYKCECGSESLISFSSFKNGSRCKKCGALKRSGSKSSRWKPTKTDEEREKGRATPQNQIFRKKVFERDNYTCQICGAYKSHHAAHHLNGWNWFVEGRYDPNNGITLCDGKGSCHEAFHKLYKLGDNTLAQFVEFKSSILLSYA